MSDSIDDVNSKYKCREVTFSRKYNLGYRFFFENRTRLNYFLSEIKKNTNQMNKKK